MTISTKDLDTEAAGPNSWAASQDAMRRNANNRQFYTADEQRRATSWRDLLDNVYAYDESFINFRQKFIVIKLTNAKVKDRAMLREIEDILDSYNVVKTVTPQGINYRFNKG